MWVARHFLRKRLNYIGFGGTGNQVRDILHIDDVCEIILIQIKKFKTINNQIFNIGGGEKSFISLRNLTLLCQKITGNKILIGRKTKTSIFDIPIYVSNNFKIFKAYNWKPKNNVKSIVKDIYLWLYKNNKLWKYFK